MLKMRNKKKQKYLFSIICATIGKANKLNNLCNSLNKQTYKKFELIICDQNKENFNKKFKQIYKNLRIIFIKSKKGLSNARNDGINRAKGNYLLFLDDDINLRSNFLKNLNKLFNYYKVPILSYKTINKKGGALLRYPKRSCNLKILFKFSITSHQSLLQFQEK